MTFIERGFLGKTLIYERLMDADNFDADECARLIAAGLLDSVEVEMPEDAEGAVTFLRFGTNPSRMEQPTLMMRRADA